MNIKGSVNTTAEIKEETLFRQERYTGGFYRTIFLPSPVSKEGTRASYRNGVLEVRMPKITYNNIQNIDIDFY